MDVGVKTEFYRRNTEKSLVYPQACWSTIADPRVTPCTLSCGGGSQGYVQVQNKTKSRKPGKTAGSEDPTAEGLIVLDLEM